MELSKLTPVLNFINILCTAFTFVDPESVKKIENLTVFFTLLGSAHVKAVHRTLMKLSLEVHLNSALNRKLKSLISHPCGE